MDFSVYGPFEMERKSNGLVDTSKQSKKEFASIVDASKFNLSLSTGCYVFALKSGGGSKAWYVGKAEGQSFSKEIFALHKINVFNDVLASKKGIPQIYLIPRLSTNGKLCWPGK